MQHSLGTKFQFRTLQPSDLHKYMQSSGENLGILCRVQQNCLCSLLKVAILSLSHIKLRFWFE